MMKWEQIATDHMQCIFRSPVPGGWLVMVVDEVITQNPRSDRSLGEQTGYEFRSSITFVPDQSRVWQP